MNYICFRFLQYHTYVQDIEVYVELHENQFQLPTEFPKRFKERIEKQFVKNVFQIKSIPFETTTLLHQSNLKQSGIWITKDDLKQVGNVSATVFGIPLHQHISWAFDVAIKQVPLESKYKIFVGYHGTGIEEYKSIQKLKKLLPSQGQLGYGIYVGSFWKGCRFAGRNQDYEFRNCPIVLRVLWYGLDEITFPCTIPCACKACESQKLELAKACAHTMNWDTTQCYGFLKPTQMSDQKWITKNEEWVFAPCCILRLGDAVELNKQSIHKPDYDPWQRDIQIL